jgi:ProP effector
VTFGNGTRSIRCASAAEPELLEGNTDAFNSRIRRHHKPPTPEQVARSHAVIRTLVARFPAAFAIQPAHRKPLKVAIHTDLLVALGGEVSSVDLRHALRRYTGHHGYRRHLLEGVARVGLTGKPSGVVTAAEAEHAAAVLLGFETRLKSREPGRTAPPVRSPSPASPASPPARRLSLADLRAAARARKAAGGAP